jgi:hypothetical protein
MRKKGDKTKMKREETMCFLITEKGVIFSDKERLEEGRRREKNDKV